MMDLENFSLADYQKSIQKIKLKTCCSATAASKVSISSKKQVSKILKDMVSVNTQTMHAPRMPWVFLMAWKLAQGISIWGALKTIIPQVSKISKSLQMMKRRSSLEAWVSSSGSVRKLLEGQSLKRRFQRSKKMSNNATKRQNLDYKETFNTPQAAR